MTLHKIPESVLVVMFTPQLDVLLLQRANEEGAPSGFWQSVTGSKDHLGETFAQTAVREVMEETGIDARAPGHELTDWRLENVYEIYPAWRHRYAPGVVFNTEHLMGLRLPGPTSVRLSPREHTSHQWLPWREAADLCTSASNAEAVLLLPRFANGLGS